MKTLSLPGEREAVPALSIEAYIPYLVNRLAITMIDYSAADFEKVGLTVPKWRVLLSLWERGECRFGELVRLTSIEPPTLSRILSSLDREKLVNRKRVPTDTRSVAVTLRPAGRALIKRTFPAALDAEETMTHGLSHDEREALKRTLIKMFENVSRRKAELAR